MSDFTLPDFPIAQTPRPRVSVSSDNINDPRFLVQPGQGFDGVVLVEGSDGSCTGSLMQDGLHILTAAHCFDIGEDSPIPNLNPDPSQTTIRFDLPTGSQSVAVAQIYIHPDWTSGDDDDNDIAIIRLAQSAPDAADRYELYTETDEVGKTFTRVGYGNSGTGNGGEINDPNTIKRFGTNIYDALGDTLAQTPATLPQDGALKPNNNPGLQLAYDFDNGNPANDAFARDYGIFFPVTGQEIGSSRGDSGGPAFIDGKIAGISSYGVSSAADLDFVSLDAETDSNNTSFGEIFADARVSSYLGWIGQTLGQSKSGDDIMNGTSRNDTLFANQGNDTVTAQGGNDLVLAGQGNDVVTGGDGDDLLGGNKGNDTVDGGAGNDAIVGGQQDDTIAGGAGNDTLSGDRGSDTLTGGDGADVFRFSAISDIEVITDFTDGVDRLSAVGLNFADLAISASGNNTTIASAAAPGLSVTLQNVAPGAINAADFI